MDISTLGRQRLEAYNMAEIAYILRLSCPRFRALLAALLVMVFSRPHFAPVNFRPVLITALQCRCDHYTRRGERGPVTSLLGIHIGTMVSMPHSEDPIKLHPHRHCHHVIVVGLQDP